MERPTEVAALPSGVVEYRLVPGRRGLVVILHGGHMRAGLPLGEEAMVAAGYSVLVPSRPGYGHTPLSTGPDPARFAAVISELSTHLGFADIHAVMGISAGGPSAVALAAREPQRVHGLALVSARSSLRYPEGILRLGSPVVFGPRSEAWTWAGVRALLRRAPQTGLRIMMSSLSTAPVRRVLDDLTAADRTQLLELFSHMRSGSGFLADVRQPAGNQAERAVTQPTLIISSPLDRGVAPKHAAHLHKTISVATMWPSPSLSHMVWHGSGAKATHDRIIAFLRDL